MHPLKIIKININDLGTWVYPFFSISFIIVGFYYFFIVFFMIGVT